MLSLLYFASNSQLKLKNEKIIIKMQKYPPSKRQISSNKSLTNSQTLDF